MNTFDFAYFNLVFCPRHHLDLMKMTQFQYTPQFWIFPQSSLITYSLPPSYSVFSSLLWHIFDEQKPVPQIKCIGQCDYWNKPAQRPVYWPPPLDSLMKSRKLAFSGLWDDLIFIIYLMSD